ncbi:hypothetical protein [Streptomyces sp. NPDC047024]|uniref:hypothetical protein n=1 Tax=Streptomyces sp. NPDC047024 TaxID=3155476 RepID=UPI0033C286EB
MRTVRRTAAAVLLTALAALATGCGHDDAATTPGAGGSPAAATSAPSGYADMEKKVDAAESAAAAADRDATSDADK